MFSAKIYRHTTKTQLIINLSYQHRYFCAPGSRFHTMPMSSKEFWTSSGKVIITEATPRPITEQLSTAFLAQTARVTVIGAHVSCVVGRCHGNVRLLFLAIKVCGHLTRNTTDKKSKLTWGKNLSKIFWGAPVIM